MALETRAESGAEKDAVAALSQSKYEYSGIHSCLSLQGNERQQEPESSHGSSASNHIPGYI